MLKLTIVVVGFGFLLIPSTCEKCLSIIKGCGINPDFKLKARLWSNTTKFKAMRSYSYLTFKPITRFKVSGEDIVNDNRYILHFTTKQENNSHFLCSIVNVPGKKLKKGINFKDLKITSDTGLLYAQSSETMENAVNPFTMYLEVYNQNGHVNYRPLLEVHHTEFTDGRSIAKFLKIEENQGQLVTEGESIYWSFT